MSDRGWLGLHSSIWKVASTHVVVDAYTNIYAPLLPLLMPHLGLTYAAAGMLAMCFQMANSVSQLGFGALADRWRPRLLVMAGPLAAVVVLSFVGVATNALMLGVILVLGGLGGAAFHPAAAALVYRLAEPHRKGLAMSAHLSGGSLGFSAAPVLFAPFIALMGLQWSPLIMIPGLLALAVTLRHVPPMELPAAHERSTWKTLRPSAVPLTLLYFTIVLRTATTYGFMSFAPTLLTEQGFTIGQASTAVSLYLFASGVGGTIFGKWDLAEGNNTTLTDQLSAILAGQSYINFHTRRFPGGDKGGDIVNIAQVFARSGMTEVTWKDSGSRASPT